MKRTLLCFLIVVSSSSAFSQHESGSFTILLGGDVGKFNVDAGGNFNRYYTDRKLAYTGLFGLGNGFTFVIAKYRLYTANGNSKLTNVDATGTAQWKQRILSAGFRLRSEDSAFYIDAMYLFNHAEESIATINPALAVLSATQKIDNNGLAFAVGLAPRIAGPLALDFNVEYSVMLQNPLNDAGRQIPNLGGLYYGAGLSFYFGN
jgi:hypothetical protein